MKFERSDILRSIPFIGIATAFFVFGFAGYFYDGDIRWSQLTVSWLCSPSLPNGEPNDVRIPAVLALAILCSSLACVFQSISNLTNVITERKFIQIAGIGSMVYTFLTVTPMHDLMVNIALLFFLTSFLFISVMLHRRNYTLLMLLGICCIALKGISVSVYYLNHFEEFWGLIQKLSFCATTAWLAAVSLLLKKETSG